MNKTTVPYSIYQERLERLAYEILVVKNELYELTEDEQLNEDLAWVLRDFEVNYLGGDKNE